MFPSGYSSEECEWSSYHLPTGVKPVQYDLEMTVELEPPYLVAGQMTVYANVTRPSKCIVMHALDMNISHINRLNPDTPGVPIRITLAVRAKITSVIVQKC